MSAKLISAKELASRYSVTAKTVRKWARCRLLPVVRLNCRCVRFDVEKCDQIIERRTRVSGSISVGALLLYTAILSPFLVAKVATNWQQNSLQREVSAFVNRWSSVQI